MFGVLLDFVFREIYLVFGPLGLGTLLNVFQVPFRFIWRFTGLRVRGNLF